MRANWAILGCLQNVPPVRDMFDWEQVALECRMNERNRSRAENPRSNWGRTNRYGRWYALGRVLTLLAMAALPVQSVRAATVLWDGSDDALWGTAANWDTVSVPSAGDTAIFNAAAGVGGSTITTGTISLGTLVFDTATASAYTIGGATAGTGQITFADGTTSIITMNSTVTQNELINANLTLGTAVASTSTITNNSTTNTLTIAGNIIGGTGGTAAAKTLTIDGAGATTISGNITKGGASTLTLTDTSTGTLTVSGNTTVNQLNMNSVGGSVINIGGGNLTISGITSGGAGLRSTTGGTINGTGTITFTQNSATNGTDNGTANGTTLTINPRITGANAFESFVASGNTGKMVLANNGNDFTGNVLINSGIVEVATIGASGVASGAGKGTSIQIGSGTNTGQRCATRAPGMPRIACSALPAPPVERRSTHRAPARWSSAMRRRSPRAGEPRQSL